MSPALAELEAVSRDPSWGYGKAVRELFAELAEVRAGRDALEASDECGVDGIPPCHAKPNATEADWCRMCLVSRYRQSQRHNRIAEELGIRFAPWHPTDPERHDNVAAAALKAELAAESALVATLQDSLSAAQVAHHETAQERDRLKVALEKLLPSLERDADASVCDTPEDRAMCEAPLCVVRAALAATPGEPS